MTEPRYRRPLNTHQLAVLQWLYDVRFSTSKQITTHLQKPHLKTIQDKLRTLEDQGFIAKRYDTTYRLAGRAAEYYLTPAGARKLPADTTSSRVIDTLYRNKSVKDGLITHSLNIADLYLTLRARYRQNITIHTKSELVRYPLFPSWLPDLFLSTKKSEKTHRYFLDLIDDTQPFFVSVRKIHSYLKYSEGGKWTKKKVGMDFPTFLTVCPNKQVQKKLHRQIRRALQETYEHINFATTTLQDLSSDNSKKKIWQSVDEDNSASDFISI